MNAKASAPRKARSGAADDPIFFTLFNEIGIIDQLGQAELAKVLPKGLSFAGFNVLNHFVRLGDGKGPAELARAFQVTKPTMTHTIQRLEKAGYVAVAPDTRDHRGKCVTLTAAGRRARQAAIAAIAPRLGELQGVITAAEVAALLPALQRLRAHLDAARNNED